MAVCLILTQNRAGSLNHLAMPLPLPVLPIKQGSLHHLAMTLPLMMSLPLPVLPIKQGSLNHFPETFRKTLDVITGIAK